MESFQLKPVRSAGEIEAMCAVAERVWHLTYDELLAPGQVDYMVEMFQSPQAVREQMAREGYRYYNVCQGEEVKGFVGFSPRYQGRDELFLSKVYLLPEIRGKGAVRQVFRFVEEEARRQGLPTIRLTVNKGNTHAARVYEHYGFQVTDSVVTDIGGGYVMDDYIMEKALWGVSGMNLFLTSQIGATVHRDGARIPGKIDNSNGFLSQFQDCVKGRGRMLYISSTPAENDKVKDWFENTRVSLKNEGITFTECLLINGRNAGSLNALVPGADVIFLSGGHLPTQNDFFQQIGLREILSQYEGTVVAQSAGSMNCAGTVYVCPELPGESLDPNFQRFRPGLGLTELNIIPHFNTNANAWLDGKRFYWEIIRPDSFKVPLYVLPDGSHFYIHKGRTELFGEGYRFYRGQFERLPEIRSG